MKTNIKRQFCGLCGQLESKLFDTKRYNTKNGKRIFIAICDNENCLDGCFNTGGHYFVKEKSRFFDMTVSYQCERCGKWKKRNNFVYHNWPLKAGNEIEYLDY